MQGSSEGSECCDGDVVKGQGISGESEKSRNQLDHERESTRSPVGVGESTAASVQGSSEGPECCDGGVVKSQGFSGESEKSRN